MGTIERSGFDARAQSPDQVDSGADTSVVETVTGVIISLEGLRINTKVEFRVERNMRQYSHVGELRLPEGLLEEFREGHERCYFYPDDNEVYDEIHVIEEIGEGDEMVEEAIVVLMRKAKPEQMN